MPARLIRDSKLILANGSIVQIRIWQLPSSSVERPHGLKYSLFFGKRGVRIVGYDNESGKGDHLHYHDREEKYVFTTLEGLIADFEADVRKALADE